jgi:hypothetical protein
MLAAGLFAAGTLFGAAGVASAGAAGVHHRDPCTTVGTFAVRFQSVSGVNYYVGTPNTTFSGATVRLKPSINRTTRWSFCQDSNGAFVIYNRNLAMTSRSVNPGGNVTVENAGNMGDGFLSQQWFAADSTTFTNARTGLSLRIRNGGPIMGQTVTTGASATAWELV